MSADGAAATSAVALLAHWWSRPVEDEVSTWVAWRADAAEVASDLAGGMAPAGLPAATSGDGPALLEEYERLFVGPAKVPCPPYESYWRDDVPIDIWHSLMGPCTAELRQLYRRLGIDVTGGQPELPDHVAVELEALAYALTRPDGHDVAHSLLTGHLGRWLPRLCKAVAAQASHPFYRDLAVITPVWLTAIAERVVPAHSPPTTP
ncbi:MAG TPA: molecular chaperone TorD family protein [Streptosporangiaceae bacterium]